jgi:hypothetical protein
LRKKAALAAVLVPVVALVGLARAEVIQDKGLRITILSQVKPFKLPRQGTAPIAVFIGGHLANTEGGIPPQLQKMAIKVNRHGLLQSRGMPICGISQIQPASTERALQNCGDALVGSGQFWANIVLPGQDPYPTRGRILIFNGRKGGKPALLVQIYTANPFNASFVIVFTISRISKGPYGTELVARFPDALGEWGYVDRIKLTLKRKYRYRGKQLSYFNAGCPAPAGARTAVYPLAYASFSFAGRKDIGSPVSKSCLVKETRRSR